MLSSMHAYAMHENHVIIIIFLINILNFREDDVCGSLSSFHDIPRLVSIFCSLIKIFIYFDKVI